MQQICKQDRTLINISALGLHKIWQIAHLFVPLPKECPDIDVNRRLEESDLTVSDLSAHIAMVIPKKLEQAIVGRAEFNRQ